VDGQSEQIPQCPVPEGPVLAADQVRARRGRAADHYPLRLTWKRNLPRRFRPCDQRWDIGVCASKNKHPTTIAPRRGSTVQIQALRATCGVICVSLQLCILTVTLSTETGVESTVCSWVKSLGAMPEQWKGRFWWPEVVDDAWYVHTKTVSNLERDLAARIAKM
jgi:hypothetical protein